LFKFIFLDSSRSHYLTQALEQVTIEYYSERDRLGQQTERVKQLKREAEELTMWMEIALEDAQKHWDEMRAREQELKKQASMEPPEVTSPECNSFAIHIIFHLVHSYFLNARYS
jgi:hypothetical protein